MRLVLAAALVALALPAAAQGTASPFPDGLYQPGAPAPPEARMLFGADGAFELSVGLRVVASGQYAATADHLVLILETGDESCMRQGAQTGIYGWAEADGAVSLRLVDDDCEGRVGALSGLTLTRVEPGDADE